MKQNSYYCVVSRYFDDGSASAMIIEDIIAEEKPKGYIEEKENFDLCVNFFDTYEEARIHAEECRNSQE